MIIQKSSSIGKFITSSDQANWKKMQPAHSTMHAINKDQVTISNIGKLASGSDQNQEEGGVSVYQLPSWMKDFTFSIESVVATIQSNGKLSGGTSGDWFEKKYPDAAKASISEVEKFSTLISDHYQGLLEKHGINNTQSHYENLILDKEFSEFFRSEMKNAIKNDTQLLTLLPRIGKSYLIE